MLIFKKLKTFQYYRSLTKYTWKNNPSGLRSKDEEAMELTAMILSTIILLTKKALYFMQRRATFNAQQLKINRQFVGADILLSGILTDILGWLGLGPKLQPQSIPVKK